MKWTKKLKSYFVKSYSLEIEMYKFKFTDGTELWRAKDLGHFTDSPKIVCRLINILNLNYLHNYLTLTQCKRKESTIRLDFIGKDTPFHWGGYRYDVTTNGKTVRIYICKSYVSRHNITTNIYKPQYFNMKSWYVSDY